MFGSDRIVGYILDENNNPVPCYDIMKWAESFEFSKRIVSQTRFKNGVFVSTVFLGLDHGFHFDGEDRPPVVFETMVFGGKYDLLQKRYCTWDEAFEGHSNAVKYFTEQMMFEINDKDEEQTAG